MFTKKILPRFSRIVAIAILVGVFVAYADTDKPSSSEGGGGKTIIIAGFATALLPKYTVSIRPSDHFHGLLWSLPLEAHWGFTQCLSPSIAWYPGEHSLFYRCTYGIPIGFGKTGPSISAVVPSIGWFTSAHSSGPRAGLQYWFGFSELNGFDVRRIIGLCAGGAWEGDFLHKRTMWEISAGLEFVIPLNY
jgi:hypothetical protein